MTYSNPSTPTAPAVGIRPRIHSARSFPADRRSHRRDRFLFARTLPKPKPTAKSTTWSSRDRRRLRGPSKADFTIDPAPASRFALSGDADRPRLPLPGPRLYDYGLDRLNELIGSPEASPSPTASTWRPHLMATPVDSPDVVLGTDLPTHSARLLGRDPRSLSSSHARVPQRRLRVPRAIRHRSTPRVLGLRSAPFASSPRPIARVNSRELQRDKEAVYLAALPVTLERFAFATKLTPTNVFGADHSALRDEAGSSEVTTFGGSLGIERLLAFGGTFFASVANELFLVYDGPEGFSRDVVSEIFVGFRQSLTQSDAALEPLIQTERDLVYAQRRLARSRQALFIEIASHYYRLLQSYRGIEIEAQNYFSLVRTFEQAQAEVRSGVKNAPNPVAVDQFEQGMLVGRSRLIARCNRLENELDELKIVLGLPTETALNIDLNELDDLTAGDQISSGRRAHRALARPHHRFAFAPDARRRRHLEWKHLSDRTCDGVDSAPP